VVGVDDGAFERGDRYAPIAAVAIALPEHVEAVRTSRVRVDGTDGTRRVIALVRRLGPLDGVRAILVDGAVVGGFNVLDLDAMSRALDRPIVAVTRRAPEFARIREALVKWFPRSARARWSLLRAHRLFRVPTAGRPILAAAVGCSRRDAVRLVQRSTVRGFCPEPLRLAHLVASAGRPRAPRKSPRGRTRRDEVQRHAARDSLCS